jgi:hypothetical protein
VEQLSIFDALETERRTEHGIARAKANTPPEWRERALMAVEYLSRARQTFTADDVWQFLHDAHVEMPHEPSALGPIMREASKKGWIRFTGQMTKSQRPVSHQNLLRVWARA